jgi:RNA recognition motif-containing protein
MEKKLYVGGINYQTTDASLNEAFSQAGTVVSASIMIDKMTGRSRGFGFVEMATEDEAQAAITMWNGKELDGRTLTVNEARPREDRPQRAGGGGGFNRGGYNRE